MAMSERQTRVGFRRADVELRSFALLRMTGWRCLNPDLAMGNFALGGAA
jgi:hypothetical protein